MFNSEKNSHKPVTLFVGIHCPPGKALGQEKYAGVQKILNK
jgi:hypothetical protein